MTETAHVVAIVDDDPKVLRALARLLSTRWLTTRTFQSGAQFLASVSKELPDCLVLDLQMPEMSGFEVQQNLKHAGIEIPIIIITAHDEAKMRERCKSAGAIAFLSKPVRAPSLFAAIDAAVGTAGK